MLKRISTTLYIIMVCVLATASALQAQNYGRYSLYSVMGSTKAYLLNLDGSVYHSWTFPSSAKTGYSSFLLPGGTLLRSVARTGNALSGAAMCGSVQKVAWDGTVLWDYVYSSATYCSHHDICPMPNGNVLLIAYDVKTPAQVTQAGCSSNITIWSEKIVEIQPTGTNTGTVVWEWAFWDHLCQNVNPAKDNYVTSILDHPELININLSPAKDWLHANGIDYNPELDQIVISSHNKNEFYVIDHSTTTAEAASHSGGNSGKGGDFLYRWGKPSNYGATGTTNFNVIHDAHWVPPGCPKAGSIAAFNNKGGTGGKSCVDIVDPPLDGSQYLYNPGTAYAPATYNWRHVYSGSASSNMSSSQQLPNGNTYICIALSGFLYEIDSNQNVVWSKSVSGSVAQSFRYTACHVSGAIPDMPTITQSGNTLTSSPGTTYQWYLGGVLITGATSQNYSPAQDGSYQVRIADVHGCESDLSDPFDFVFTGIDAYQNIRLTVFPNPATSTVTIAGFSGTNRPYVVNLYNAVGEKVFHRENISTLDVSFLPRGMYILTVAMEGTLTLNQKIVLVP